MVSQGRFELPTFPLGGGCSIQLSYWDTNLSVRQTACMLTAGPCFVMSSAGLFKCRQAPCKGAGRFTVQFASPQKATIAKCNAAHPKNPAKCLFLKDLTAVRLLARRLLYRFLYKNNRRLVS
ncbi:hypothetical protein EMIT0P2_20406 [Pseudomonas sp. IT-P2]